MLALFFCGVAALFVAWVVAERRGQRVIRIVLGVGLAAMTWLAAMEIGNVRVAHANERSRRCLAGLALAIRGDDESRARVALDAYWKEVSDGASEFLAQDAVLKIMMAKTPTSTTPQERDIATPGLDRRAERKEP